MTNEHPASDRQVLVLAPTTRDGEATASVLKAAGIPCLRCERLEHVCVEVLKGAAAVILPEETVLEDDFARLTESLRSQPVWSDLPVIVLSSANTEPSNIEKLIAGLGNVSVIERPMRISTFLSVVRVAVRAREKQYEVRDHLEERKRAAETLARDAMLLGNVRDAVVVTDLEGIVTYWNEGAMALFGWTADEMAGRPIWMRAPKESQRGMQEWVEKIAGGGGEFEGEWLDHRKDGSPVWIEARTRLARGPRGAVFGIIGVSRDITQRKEAESELKKAKEAAEAANMAKDEFLAVLSHELRTPLTPVLLTASMLEANLQLPESVRRDVGTIRENVELESRLIGDLLDVTRISKGKLQLDLEALDLHQVIRAAVAICLREASAALSLRLEAKHSTVHGDKTRMQQIFWNLINNATKFTGHDGAIEVRSYDIAGGRIGVEVSDTGEGIEPEVLPKLFNAFEQGNIRTGRQRAGLGLGLSISRRLAEMQDGTITARSAGRGQGATFTVEFPVIDAALPTERAVNGAGGTDSEGSLSVLLVEDHEATMTVMAKILRSKGHRVTTATTVASAKAAATLNGFDLIISDLGLPDGSGLDVMRSLKEKYAGRAIALTGFGMESDIAACRSAGFAEHLTKPVDLERLEGAIRRVVGKIR